jgi:hypothetical protein
MPTSSPDKARAADNASPDGAARPNAGWLNIAKDSHRSAPGLEWLIWRKLPWVALAGAALPLLALALIHLLLGGEGAAASEQRLVQLADFVAIGLLAFHGSLLVTVAIGCMIVMIMKGPHYTADSYTVPHRDRPRT